MKIIKFLILGIISLSSLVINAQGSRNDNPRNNQGNERPGQINRDRPQTMAANTERQYRQPQNVNNNINYRNETPRITASRPDNGAHMTLISYNNRNYHYDKGIYYQNYNNNYIRVAPPVGLRISFLPVGYININIGNQGCYYYEGTYYSRTANNYMVIAPPSGAVVYALPANYEKVEVNGIIYYEYNGTLYQKIIFNGQPAYQIVGNMN